MTRRSNDSRADLSSPLSHSVRQEVGEPDEDVKMHVYERTYGKIERMFRLPDNAEDEKIEASMKNGVLTVHIPKAPEEAKEEIPERTIKIK